MSVRLVTVLASLVLVLLFVSAGVSAAPPAQTELTPEQWRQDLRVLADSLVKIHPNPFYKTPQAEFERAVSELDREIPMLARDDIVAGLLRISAMIDGHSHLRFTDEFADFHMFPLRLYEFSDGIFAIDATDAYSQVVGAKLVQIGDTPIEEAYPLISPFAYNDNVSSVKLFTPIFLIIPEVLHAQGLIRDLDAPHLVFEKPNGERVTLDPKPLPINQYLPLLAKGTFYSGLPKRDAPLMQQQRDETFWYTELPESNTLYIQYNEVRASTPGGGSLLDLANEVSKRVEENDYARIVVDVRHNGGGDNHTYWPLLNLLKDNPKVNQRGKLFLITGRQTFSAASNFSTEVEQKTNAIIAGEPMGGSPNLYGDTVPVTLPNSKMQLGVSARSWVKSYADDPRLTIEPQLPVELSSQDYFAQRDPVLDAIITYTPRPLEVTIPAPRTVTFETGDGATLMGTVYGAGTTGIVFSNMGAHHQDTWAKMAERAAARGYMGLTYDNRYWVSATQTNDPLRSKVPDDVRAAVKFLRSQGAQRIVLIGASLGSMASAKVAAETNPAAVVLMASPVDRTGLPFLVTSDEIRAIASPKLFLVAENDENGFTPDVKKMFEMARTPRELKMFPGKAHGTDVFKSAAGDAVMDEILAFLETHVKLPPDSFFDKIDTQPAVARGTAGTWEDRFVDPGAVVFHNGVFHMLRNGFRAFPDTVQVGYAISRNGLTWSKQGNDPVLKTEQVPYAKVAALASSALVQPDGTWVLYFYTWDSKGYPSRGSIGRATAKLPSGPWEVDAEPVLEPGSAGEWDENQVLAPDVILTDDGYVMYYSGSDKNGAQKIGRATSSDGIHWVKYNDPQTTTAPFASSDPVFDVGAAGAWDAGMVHQPRVRRLGNEWVMFYRGTKGATGQASLEMGLGLARSKDGIHWTRATSTPILTADEVPGANYFWFTNVIVRDDTVYLFWELDIGEKTQVYVATHTGVLP